jgi:hypothetical protein
MYLAKNKGTIDHGSSYTVVSVRYAIFFPYSWSPSNAPQNLLTRFALRKGIKMKKNKLFLSPKNFTDHKE